jgi:D-aminopeptidase
MNMSEQTFWESFKAESDNFVERLKAVIHEGNVRRVIVQQGDRTIAEFPLTAGVVGAVLAPVVAAIGAIVALSQDCRIQVERVERDPAEPRRDSAA